MDETTAPKGELHNYFSTEIKVLKFCGISITGYKSVPYRIYSVLYLSLSLGYPFVAFGDLFKHDFDVVADLLIYELASFMTGTEVIVMLLNRSKVKKLLDKLEEEPFYPNPERGGEVEEKLVRGCISVTSIQARICWLSVLATVGMATVATLIKRIKSRDYNDWEFTYGPLTVLNVTYSPNYEITWFYQIVCTSTIGFNHCTINLIMAGILAHASVQFKVLQNNLRRIVENGYGLMMKNEADNNESTSSAVVDASTIPYKYLKQSLDATVIYHLKILEITKEVEDIFGALMLTVFLFSLGVMCFLVYHASLLSMTDMRFLKTFTDTMSALFPILLLCYWSQEVVFESQEVGKAAFYANFVGTDDRFQKSLAMIIRRSQTPRQLKAGKFIEISLPTFVWILRTSYSAFMVLRSVNAENILEDAK